MRSSTRSLVLTISVVSGLLLPTLSLIPLGSFWLWERGWLLYWALSAALIVVAAFLLQRWLLGPEAQERPVSAPTEAERSQADGDPGWTPAETAAWAEVQRIGATVDVTKLNSQDAVLALALDTIKAVAERLHPEVSEPEWQFTVPEALSLLERVSRRLGVFAVTNVPFADRMTVAQVLALYRWRGAVHVAEKAYDVWRMMRMLNPLTAATHELRERLSRQMLAWGQTQMTERFARAYVNEVGRAAIDLYGGRLRVASIEGLSQQARTDSAAIDARVVEPLRILIAGQTSAGKSSLVNAMAGAMEATVDALPATSAFVPYVIQKSDLPRTHLIDSPGLDTSPASSLALLDQSLQCDMILWVVAAHRADRDLDRRVLSEFRKRYQSLPDRRQPPLLVVLSQIDRLRPLADWDPPYDLGRDNRPKASSIKSAIEIVSQDLGVSAPDVVPVSLAQAGTYNLDALWAKIYAALPDARRAQLIRQIRATTGSWDWRRAWDQTVAAGRVIAQVIKQ